MRRQNSRDSLPRRSSISRRHDQKHKRSHGGVSTAFDSETRTATSWDSARVGTDTPTATRTATPTDVTFGSAGTRRPVGSEASFQDPAVEIEWTGSQASFISSTLPTIASIRGVEAGLETVQETWETRSQARSDVLQKLKEETEILVGRRLPQSRGAAGRGEKPSRSSRQQSSQRRKRGSTHPPSEAPTIPIRNVGPDELKQMAAIAGDQEGMATYLAKGVAKVAKEGVRLGVTAVAQGGVKLVTDVLPVVAKAAYAVAKHPVTHAVVKDLAKGAFAIAKVWGDAVDVAFAKPSKTRNKTTELAKQYLVDVEVAEKSKDWKRVNKKWSEIASELGLKNPTEFEEWVVEAVQPKEPEREKTAIERPITKGVPLLAGKAKEALVGLLRPTKGVRAMYGASSDAPAGEQGAGKFLAGGLKALAKGALGAVRALGGDMHRQMDFMDTATTVVSSDPSAPKDTSPKPLTKQIAVLQALASKARATQLEKSSTKKPSPKKPSPKKQSPRKPSPRKPISPLKKPGGWESLVGRAVANPDGSMTTQAPRTEKQAPRTEKHPRIMALRGGVGPRTPVEKGGVGLSTPTKPERQRAAAYESPVKSDVPSVPRTAPGPPGRRFTGGQREDAVSDRSNLSDEIAALEKPGDFVPVGKLVHSGGVAEHTLGAAAYAGGAEQHREMAASSGESEEEAREQARTPSEEGPGSERARPRRVGSRTGGTRGGAGSLGHITAKESREIEELERRNEEGGLSEGGMARLKALYNLPEHIPIYDSDGYPIHPRVEGGGDDPPQRRGQTAGVEGGGDVPARRQDGGGGGGGGGTGLHPAGDWSPQAFTAHVPIRKRRRRPPKPPQEDLLVKKDISTIVSRISDSLHRKFQEGQRVVVQQPMIPHVITDAVKKPSTAEQAKIIIKQQVKQTVNEQKRRKKSSKQVDKAHARNKRKEYNDLKKAIKKRFSKLKKTELKRGSADIKRMKPSDRKGALARLRNDLTEKLRALVLKMPSSSKKNASELDVLISRITKLKW